MLGELDLFEGDPDAAEERIRESLVICTHMGSDLDRAASLTALGGVEALRGKSDEARTDSRRPLALRAGAARGSRARRARPLSGGTRGRIRGSVCRVVAFATRAGYRRA